MSRIFSERFNKFNEILRTKKKNGGNEKRGIKHICVTIVNHRIIPGMVSYGFLWPCGNLIEQTYNEKRSYRNYDWGRCFRFGLFGAFFQAPILYFWLRFALVMWPKCDLKSSLGKSITEQGSFDPTCNAAFLFCMALMDGNTVEQAGQNVRENFFDIYKVGVVYWPFVSSFNYLFIPLRYQVVATSMFSLVWTTFLACF